MGDSINPIGASLVLIRLMCPVVDVQDIVMKKGFMSSDKRVGITLLMGPNIVVLK